MGRLERVHYALNLDAFLDYLISNFTNLYPIIFLKKYVLFINRPFMSNI